MGNGKKNIKYFFLCFIGLTVLTIFFLNCQRQPVSFIESSSKQSHPDDDHNLHIINDQNNAFKTELDAAQAPFINGKVHVPKTKESTFAKLAPSAAGSLKTQTGSRWIVVLNNECVNSSQNTFTNKFSNKVFDPKFYNSQLTTQSYIWIPQQDVNLSELIQAAESDDCVIGLSPDSTVEISSISLNDPELSNSRGQVSLGVNDTYSFFNNPQFGARETVTVAIIDTGVNHAHEDLRANLWTDTTGEYFGFNFAANNNFVYDEFGHGTQVAGVIGAVSNNGVGISGVLGHNIKLLSLKILGDNGTALVSDMVRAIDYARSLSVDVINISMGSRGHQPTLQSAINSAVNAGIVLTFPAGNDGIQLTNDNSSFEVPAGYAAGLNGAICVGAIDSESGAKSSFSNFSTTYVEIAAPGSNGLLLPNKNGSYSTNTGTSFAAPAVAGAAALVISFFKKNQISYNPALVESTIMNSANQNTQLQSYYNGGRVLDLRSLSSYLQRNYLVIHDGGYNEN